MTEFPKAITEHWNRLFSCGEIIQAGQDLTITINPDLKPQRSVMLLRQTDSATTHATLTPKIASLLSLHAGAQPLSLKQFRVRLSEAGVVFHGADLIFYCADNAKPRRAAEGATAHQLTERDELAFAAFQSEAPEQDKDDAFVELDHWAVFGVFEQERLVSAASMYPWDDATIVDIGVLTLPGFRGKGYAKALVHAMRQYALNQGHQPQYRCQWDNKVSSALAQAVGFSLFGMWEVVVADTPLPAPTSASTSPN